MVVPLTSSDFQSMRKRLLTYLIMIMTGFYATGQNPVLEQYIREGIASNHTLQQRLLDYHQSLAALKAARGLFYPDISVNARYTVANGGRVISFPVGDLLNPVYNTLNLLTASDRFPEIENQEFNFYRPQEQETKLSLVQPIFNSDIIYNAKIREEYAELARVDVNQYKRSLIMEIKTSYYNYQKAYQLQDLLDTTLLLVKENQRVSKSLFENDMVTADVVYRSEAEVSRILAEQARASSQLIAARTYFNFLLNRPLETRIEILTEQPSDLVVALDAAQESAVEGREELQVMRQYLALNAHKRKMQQGSATPDLFGAVDYGFQGEEYSFTSEDDFVLASLVLRWHLFQGMTNRNKVQETIIEGDKLRQVQEETEQKIRMQVINLYYQALASYQEIDAARMQVRSADKAFRLIDRKYRQNQATLLEYIDARTTLTSAKSKHIIAINDYFIRLAALEHVMAAVDLDKYIGP